jgi:thiamine biosynthesis lipoprotein
MGTDAHVLVHGDDAAALADSARDDLEELERRWSRFLPDSEISRLNAADGAPRVVSPATSALVNRAVEGWEITGGRFDPTVLGDVIRAGYDRSFENVPAVTAPGVSDWRRGCAGIEVDEQVDVVRLPSGVAFDPGGIGKGYAADRVVATTMHRGARGACVNVGGDVRVEGVAPGGGSWVVAVLDPFTERPLETVTVASGGVATTSRTKRRWIVDDHPAHHVIDPVTGRPAARDVASVTTIAAESWQAEVFAKAAFVAGEHGGLDFLEQHGVAGLLTDGRGGRAATVTWSRFHAAPMDPAHPAACLEEATR